MFKLLYSVFTLRNLLLGKNHISFLKNIFHSYEGEGKNKIPTNLIFKIHKEQKPQASIMNRILHNNLK